VPGPTAPNRKAWATTDLTLVAKIFSKLPTSDRNAVQGLELERIRAFPSRAGDTWHTLAMFEHTTGIRGGAGNRLIVSDRAVATPPSTASGPTEAERTVAHEAAHAIETEAARAAFWAVSDAENDYNAKVQIFNRQRSTPDAAYRASDVAYNEYSDLCDQWTAKNKQVSTLFNRYKQKADYFNALIDADQDPAPARAPMETAKAEWKAAEAARNRIAALRDAAQRRKDDLYAEYERKLRELEEGPEADMNAALRVVDRKKGDLRRVYSEARQLSHRVLNFEKFVNQSSISPRLTAYAEREWPGKPGEFYAEAYSYWLMDKTALQRYSQPLFSYFDSGKYRLDSPPS
jgi:hypothetical protein